MASSSSDAVKPATQTEFPTSIAEFGYAFNNDGQLKQIDPDTGLAGDKPFEFAVSAEFSHNQRRYEALGDLLTDHVYDLLLEVGLKKLYVPDDIPEANATFVFGTTHDFSQSKKLMILIHGSGVVRAGIWARSLIINQSLNHGTQIPYIRKAIELGYDVLVTNTNDNTRAGKSIPRNGSPVAHATYVWNKYVDSAKDAAIAIVAHSYGGVVAQDLATRNTAFFKDHVFAVGLTDSVHGYLSGDVAHLFHEIGRNWVTSEKVVDTPLRVNNKEDVPRYSAGHTKHEWTSWACMEALFRFCEQKYVKFVEEKTVPANKKAKTDL